MSNTSNNDHAAGLALPPLPAAGVSGPEVCAVVRLYLAVWDDLSPVQMHAISEHILSCVNCAREQRLMRRATQLVASLPVSEPSSHVDRAVLTAIATRDTRSREHGSQPLRALPRSRRMGRSPSGLAALVAVAAIFMLALLLSAHFLLPGASSHLATMQLPANLSWKDRVLYATQTMVGQGGERYHVMSYHNMAEGSMNVETVLPGKLDVVVVKEGQKSLGLDMMHHVAQWDTQGWDGADDSMFDLNQLRRDLQSGRCVYQGKDSFKGQDVYRLRYSNGQVLLLDMHYMPVNVLEDAHGPGTGRPMYDTLHWLPPSQVSSSMWDMQVPSGFTMGELPAKP